jgi:hypothetical protein
MWGVGGARCWLAGAQYNGGCTLWLTPCSDPCAPPPAGAVDEFEVTAAVGDVMAVRIGHDNTGPDPAWRLQVGWWDWLFVLVACSCFLAARVGCLDRHRTPPSPPPQDVQVQCLGPVTSATASATVTVTPTTTSVTPPTLRFVADRWLASDLADGQTWVTLVSSDSTGDTGDGQPVTKRYSISVSVKLQPGCWAARTNRPALVKHTRSYLFEHSQQPPPPTPPHTHDPLWPPQPTPQVDTSDIRGAGTDAKVFLVLHGADGRQSGRITLHDAVRSRRLAGATVLRGLRVRPPTSRESPCQPRRALPLKPQTPCATQLPAHPPPVHARLPRRRRPAPPQPRRAGRPGGGPRRQRGRAALALRARGGGGGRRRPVGVWLREVSRCAQGRGQGRGRLGGLQIGLRGAHRLVRILLLLLSQPPLTPAPTLPSSRWLNATDSGDTSCLLEPTSAPAAALATAAITPVGGSTSAADAGADTPMTGADDDGAATHKWVAVGSD